MVLHVIPRVSFRLCGKIFRRIDILGDTFNPGMAEGAVSVATANFDGLVSLSFGVSFSVSWPSSSAFFSREGLSGVGDRMLWKVSGRPARDFTGERGSDDTGLFTSKLHGGSERSSNTQLFVEVWIPVGLFSRGTGTFSLHASAHAHGDVRC